VENNEEERGSLMEVINPLNAVNMVREATRVIKNDAFMQVGWCGLVYLRLNNIMLVERGWS
jgi:hypothetical protein